MTDTNIKKAMRDVFLERILEFMAHDEKIFFLSADFGSPVIDKIRSSFPERFINVGIAEQNLINVSTGLALEGFKVVAYAIAPFITMRCFEQIRVNLAILSEVREINVTLVGVGAGISYGMSGPTHQALEDLTIMRALPNVEVYSPSDWVVAGKLADVVISSSSPKYLRFDSQYLPQINSESVEIADGFTELKEGDKLCVISTSYMTHVALDILGEREEKIGLIDFFQMKGFDSEKLQSTLKKYSHIITVEEGFEARGGLDSLIAHFCAKNEIDTKVIGLGLENKYQFEISSRKKLQETYGLGEQQINAQIDRFLGE